MSKLRISIVEYLNTAPLVWGFTRGPLAGRYDLSFTVPSQCADELRHGDADVAIIPAVEYQRMENVVALPDMSIAAKREVRSILLLARGPIEGAHRIALDTSSRSSAALVRLLCARRWKIQPEFIDAAPDPAEMLAQADAALIIGDPALRVALERSQQYVLAGRAGACTAGDSQAAAGGALYLYDVAYEWRELTGKPCVLALWVARRDAATPEVLRDFLASKEYGLSRIPEIAEWASAELQLPAELLARYLTENIDFSLDAENRAGLELYFQMCAEEGLIPRARPLEFAFAARSQGM